MKRIALTWLVAFVALALGATVAFAQGSSSNGNAASAARLESHSENTVQR